MKIRYEQPEDCQIIHQLTAEAFAPVAISDNTEPFIIDTLRADGDLSLSLVADLGNELVGHVAFSPVTIGNLRERWFGLGPVSVKPTLQRQGIGTAIINEGLRILRERDADGCVLVGDPAYYSKFGFRSDGRVQYSDVPNQYVQWLAFNDLTPKGEIKYSRAFEQ